MLVDELGLAIAAKLTALFSHSHELPHTLLYRLWIATLLAQIGAISLVYGQIRSSTITGSVKDATGAIVASATVSLVNQDTNISATTTTTDSSTKFIAAAKVGTVVTGEAVALHRGRTTQVWQTSVRRDDGKLCAVVTQTQLVIAG